jgi:acetyltransferase-like isoleucine patch superfamily enzyme
MINDTTKPLVLVGSNSAIYKFIEIFEDIGYTIAGIIDDDYYGQGNFMDIPIIASEQELRDNIDNFKQKYQFICVTNWLPQKDLITVRNKEKRIKITNMLDELGLDVATAISPRATVSPRAKLGKGVIVDSFAMIEPGVIVGDYTVVYAFTLLGHDCSIGKSCVIGRMASVISYVTVEDMCYFGHFSRANKPETTIGTGTWLYPNILLHRGTTPYEEISIMGKDLRRVYSGWVEEN